MSDQRPLGVLPDARWTAPLVDEVYNAFVEHPDFGEDDIMTKLKGQIDKASPRQNS